MNNSVVKNSVEYKNKVILAPMVRVGTLPMRLLALEYGADLVYTEELIDLKLVKAKRRINSVLGTVDFVDPSDGNIIFRTCDNEKGRVILQLGTSDSERALTVGKLVQHDVAALDINMGCPKEFSVKGGMGAALLSNPEKAKSILKALVDNLTIPVTCKIRILPDVDNTIQLVQNFASVGISAIAIHARTRDERPHNNPHPDVIKKIVDCVDIPIIANGGSREIENFSDIEKFKSKCGVESIMIARAAQGNVSIFRKEGILPLDVVIRRYLQLCVDYDNAPSNTKYCIQNILKAQQETPRGKRFLNCQTLQQICEIWDLGDYCYKKQIEYQQQGNSGRREVIPGFVPGDDNSIEHKLKKLRREDVLESNIAFFRSNYSEDQYLPKSMLHLYATRVGQPMPSYETQREDKLFRTVITFNGKKYASSYWEKNKKFAEQGAALVCLLKLGLVTEASLIKNGSILR